MFEPAAAGDFHSDDRHGLYIVVRDYLRQLLGIVDAVELRAADKGYVVFDEFFVERRIGVGGAVGGDEQLCAVKIRRVYRHELYLNRPLAQSALHSGGLSRRGVFLAVNRHEP